MKNEDLLRALGEIDDETIVRAGERLGVLPNSGEGSSIILFKEEENTVNSKKIRKLSKTALIAAVIAAVLAVTALAAMVLGTKVQPTDGLEGSWGTVNGNKAVTFENAKLFVTFDSDKPRHEYQFKANWLPSEPTCGSLGVYTDYISDDGEGSIIPYVVNSYNKINIQGIRYCFEGKEKEVRQDIWNGYERTELALDYAGTPYGYDIVNYLLLFQPEDNYLVYIAGTNSMDDLEKIAENLEIRVGNEIDELYDAGDDIGLLDLGRG